MAENIIVRPGDTPGPGGEISEGAESGAESFANIPVSAAGEFLRKISDVPPTFANAIPALGGVFPWTDVTGTTQALATDNGYVANNAALVTLTLPATTPFGCIIEIVGFGAGGWKIAQNAGQTIHFGNVDTTAGVGGSIASTNEHDTIRIVCVKANTDFAVNSSQGNLLPV